MKRYLTFTFLLILSFSGFQTASAQQIDTIRPDNHKLQTRLLATGLNQYLVYFQDSKNDKVLRLALWMRDIAIINHHQHKAFAITQHWYSPDTAAYRHIYSVNQLSDFSPIYHAETIGSKTKAYNWYADHITSADTVAHNQQKDFNLKFDQPVFNWNLDMETYEMLPLAEGKSFAISFYDAGLTPPVYELVKVTGSEVLVTLDNQKVECWVLTTSGEQNKMVYTQKYWISKKGHELLKEEDEFGGRYRYKIRLPKLTPDILKKFVVKS